MSSRQSEECGIEFGFDQYVRSKGRLLIIFKRKEMVFVDIRFCTFFVILSRCHFMCKHVEGKNAHYMSSESLSVPQRSHYKDNQAI